MQNRTKCLENIPEIFSKIRVILEFSNKVRNTRVTEGIRSILLYITNVCFMIPHYTPVDIHVVLIR